MKQAHNKTARAAAVFAAGMLISGARAESPMKIESLQTIQPVIPVLVRKALNPVVALEIKTSGGAKPISIASFGISMAGTTRLQDVKSVQLFVNYDDKDVTAKLKKLGASVTAGNKLELAAGPIVLKKGMNRFWVSVEMEEGADLDGRVDAGFESVRLSDGSIQKPEKISPAGAQRVGYAVRLKGDDKSSDYRIPGLAMTKAGTLIAVYDIRWKNGGDLPGDIDIGMSRSTNGGTSWEPMRIIMDMGKDPKWNYDGIGDPAVLVDERTGRIWVAALWSHGPRAWNGSGSGMTPVETGQFVLTYSDDDGRTWAQPYSITNQIKKPEWKLLLQGPGSGITLRDGTIVFAAQYRDETKSGLPYSTMVYSKDHGKTWQIGAGVKSNTTEAQVAELKDGSVMINCRDNRGGSRTIAVTKDLGKTWTLHPTDRKALPEPVCMASLLRIRSLLFFSNPAATNGRHHMTLQVSDDDGMTWPEGRRLLYDSRHGSGYSCLAPAGNDKIGVLYEGGNELFFLRFPISEFTAPR